jgi:hypothetical protein
MSNLCLPDWTAQNDTDVFPGVICGVFDVHVPVTTVKGVIVSKVLLDKALWVYQTSVNSV